MTLPLPSALISLKNATDTDTPVLVAAKINMDGLVSPIRIVRNEADVNWTDPDTAVVENWVAFPFEVDDIGEPQRGELPQVVLRVSNITRAVQGYVDQADGGVGADVRIYVFTPGEVTPFYKLRFEVSSTSCNEEWVTFQLTTLNLWRRRTPSNACLKNHCPYRFKGLHCGYAGVETTCDHTLNRCRVLGNEARFGGFPSVGFSGIRV